MSYRFDNTPARFCSSSTRTSEKICVEVKRIFDACIQRSSIENAQLTVSFPQPTTGLTIKSVTSSGTGVVSNLNITPLPKSIFSRVTYTLTIPIQVTATDAVGNLVFGTSSYVVNKDILLRVPASTALVPVQIEGTASVVGLNNTLSDSVLTSTLCITIITKVYADVIVSIPTYGYPCIPPCQEYAEDLCDEIFNRPLYPNGNIPFGVN